jgi:hypothetical protein
MSRSILLLLTTLIACSTIVSADKTTDAARLGSFYTTIPLYRSGSGTNVLTVGVGKPAQQVNLTLSEQGNEK